MRALPVAPREKDAVANILNEITDYHGVLDEEHLIEMVNMEAARHGIHPEITEPIVKDIIYHG